MTLEADYCGLVTAKLLKEVGYNYETEKIWYDPYQYPQSDIPHNRAKLLWKDALSPEQRHWPRYQFPAPLQCVVQKWLRDLHDLHIILDAKIKNRTICFEYHITDLRNLRKIIQSEVIEGVYEDCLEAALIKCLEIIKNNPSKEK